jgi:hypothetical protein
VVASVSEENFAYIFIVEVNMEAVTFYEKLVTTCKTARHYDPEDQNPKNVLCRQNLILHFSFRTMHFSGRSVFIVVYMSVKW